MPLKEIFSHKLDKGVCMELLQRNPNSEECHDNYLVVMSNCGLWLLPGRIGQLKFKRKNVIINIYTVSTVLYLFTGFIQASLCKIQGLLKDFPTVFKD